MRILSKRRVAGLLVVALALGSAALAAELVARRAETRAEKVLECRMKAADSVDVDVTAFDAVRAVATGRPPAAILLLPWQLIADRTETFAGRRAPGGGAASPVEATKNGLVVTRDTRFGSVTARIDVKVVGSKLDFGIDSVEVAGQQLSGSILEGVVGERSIPTVDLADWLPAGVRVQGGETSGDGLRLSIAMDRDAMRKLEKDSSCRRQTS